MKKFFDLRFVIGIFFLAVGILLLMSMLLRSVRLVDVLFANTELEPNLDALLVVFPITIVL